MAIGFGEPREVTRGRMVEVRTNSEDETEDREGRVQRDGRKGYGEKRRIMGGPLERGRKGERWARAVLTTLQKMIQPVGKPPEVHD